MSRMNKIEDLLHKEIANIFVDPLRKLRALRFAGRTGSDLEKETADAILTDNSLEDISAERIRDEFKKSVISAKSTKKYLNMVSKFKLWSIMFPTLQVNENYVETNTWIVQLAMLFIANEPEVLKKEMNKLTFTNDEIDSVLLLKELMAFDPASVFDLHKKFINTKIDKKDILEFAKINKLDIKTLKVFFKYKPSTKGQDVMKEYGVRGPEIALKIKQIEAEKFSKLL